MTIKKEDLELWARQFNDGLLKYENNDYLSKKHLFDYVDSKLSDLVNKYNLNIES